MRIGSVQPGRPEYYDRNPVMVQASFLGFGTVPHGATTRWTYTVPTGSKAYVEFVFARAYRGLAGAPGAAVEVSIYYTPFGTGGAPVFDVAMRTNVVGDVLEESTPSFGLFLAGDTLASTTLDASTGGNVDYNVTMKATQFDV